MPAGEGVGLVQITQQVVSALFFLLFGGLFYWLSGDLTIGTAADMGVGYTPRLLSFGCLSVGAILMAAAILGRSGALSERVTFAARPLLLVTAMTAGFALVLPYLGLPVAVFALVLAAALSGERFRVLSLLSVAAGLAVLTTAVFSWALNLQLPIWPAGLGQ